MTRFTLLFALLLALLSRFAFAAEPPPIAPEARCPVCGMYPARYPKWAAQVVFSDGAQTAFDSPAELFRFLQNLSRYDTRHSAKDIAQTYVSDYAKGGWLAAGAAHFVLGSRARGPMHGPDLPAFASAEEATAFAAKNGGKLIPFAEVTPAVIAGLAPDAQHDAMHDAMHDHKAH